MTDPCTSARFLEELKPWDFRIHNISLKPTGCKPIIDWISEMAWIYCLYYTSGFRRYFMTTQMIIRLDSDTKTKLMKLAKAKGKKDL
jgi:hypothetical protein